MDTKQIPAPEEIIIIGGASGTIEIEIADDFADSLAPEEIQQFLPDSENTLPR